MYLVMKDVNRDFKMFQNSNQAVCAMIKMRDIFTNCTTAVLLNLLAYTEMQPKLISRGSNGDLCRGHTFA